MNITADRIRSRWLLVEPIRYSASWMRASRSMSMTEPYLLQYFTNANVDTRMLSALITINMSLVVHCKKQRYDVYIGRPSAFGNPFVIGKDGDRDDVIRKFEQYLLKDEALMARAKKELKGKVLGCFCAPQKCHGDILAKYANEQ